MSAVEHPQCLTPIPVYVLDILPAGLKVLVGDELWTSNRGFAVDGGWLWRNGDIVRSSREMRGRHLVYPAGWEPPTEGHPFIREMPDEPPTSRWLAWTYTASYPYSWHPTELEARAAAWDREHPKEP